MKIIEIRLVSETQNPKDNTAQDQIHQCMQGVLFFYRKQTLRANSKKPTNKYFADKESPTKWIRPFAKFLKTVQTAQNEGKIEANKPTIKLQKL